MSEPQSETPPDVAVDQQPPAAAPEENPEIKRLTAELEATRKRVNDLAYALQAGERDREEFKQRQARERERMLDVEKGNIAQLLLEAVDQLDLVLNAAEESR